MRRSYFHVPAEIERRKRLNLFKLTGLGAPPSDARLEEWVIRDLAFRRGMVATLGIDSLANATCGEELRVFSYLVFIDPPFPVLWERIERDPSLGDMVLELGRNGIYEKWLAHRENYSFTNLQLFSPVDEVSFLSKLIAHCFFT